MNVGHVNDTKFFPVRICYIGRKYLCTVLFLKISIFSFIYSFFIIFKYL